MVHWLEKKTVYEGNILTVKSGRVEMDNGEAVSFDIVEHAGGVAVVPFLWPHPGGEGDPNLGPGVLLVRQPRVAVEEELLEIPAGKREADDDDLMARARAELEEETGYRAGRLVQVADFFVSPGFSTERIVVFIGFELTFVGAHPEATEEIDVVRLSLAEVTRMLDEGRFRDSKTIIGLYALLAYLDRESRPQ
jgi:ADP-ribose pyrophosphatase